MTAKVQEEISDWELAAMTNAIKNTYGIDFTNYEKKSLKRGFIRLMGKNGMESVADLWEAMSRDYSFFKGSVDELTVNLTELFRNPEIWEVLDREVLEEVKHKPVINIWHAGCSTGEEVYSMAMVLDHNNLLHRTRALATDLSAAAMKRAVQGSYPEVLVGKYEAAFQKYLPTARMNDMFDMKGSYAVVKERFRGHVEFKVHNLVSDGMDEKFDIIFCRNVMIYFDDKLKMKVLKLLSSCLHPGGFLVLGYYDMLPEKAKALVEVYDAKARIYRPKRDVNEGANGRIGYHLFTAQALEPSNC